MEVESARNQIGAAVRDSVDMLRADAPRDPISSLPSDLLAKVRSRIRIVALFLVLGFGFDVLLDLVQWAAARAGWGSGAHHSWGAVAWLNAGGLAASAGLGWVAGWNRISTSRLHTLGLAYQVFICFVIAILTYGQYFAEYGHLPNLTWVPAIMILFPLLLPGPPRRMLAAAILAGAMPPLAILILSGSGRIDATAESYFQSAVGSTFAVIFASIGAHVVYGLGRELAVARQLGSYILEEKLGEGGMGEVWRARHRLLARPAAIKMILPEAEGARRAPTPEARERFEREAQATAQLRSPHTVNVFDFGVAENGAFYYAMELLDGLDAERLVRRFGPMPPERAIHILRQVCHSLSEAESRKLVHRDIKPANLFICRYGEDHDFVKVLDFGLVRALSDPGAEELVTDETVVRGTPAFIAPEQAMGMRDIDGRADIYATGCVAYWLLTGSPVFHAESAVGLLAHHLSTPPPLLRTEIPVPDALHRIVRACLAKDRAERPQTARELSHLLSQVDGADLWTEERARSWWEIHLPAATPSDTLRT